MKLPNPFVLNDWRHYHFLLAIYSVQSFVFGLILLGELGIEVIIIRPVILVVYLIFIPGVVLLRTFRIHHLGTIKTIILSVGLSLFFLMMVGFSINILLPPLGISKPLSIIPLTTAIGLIVLLLSVVCHFYEKDKAEMAPPLIELKLNKSQLFFILMPFATIIGTFLLNLFNINTILMIIIIGIASSILFTDRIPRNVFPLAIFSISLSLLFHRSLISFNLWGWDIFSEYYFSSLVLSTGYWDVSIYSNVNSLLSINVLAPIFSIMCDVSLTLVYKLIFPLLYAFVPLVLFSMFKEYIGERFAFLSVFFFVSLFTFYGVLVILPRQEIAELFFVIIIFLFYEPIKNIFSQKLLLILFGFSIIVSHYGISIFFSYYLIILTLLYFFIKRVNGKIPLIRFQQHELSAPFSIVYLVLFMVMLTSWFIYVSGSSVFDTVIQIVNNIYSKITELLDPATSEGLAILSKGTISPSYTVLKYITLASQFLIFMGFVSLWFRSFKEKIRLDYILFSFSALFLLATSLVLPFLAQSMSITRLFANTLLILAPLFIFGYLALWGIISKILNKKAIGKDAVWPIRVLSIFLVISFLFNVGFVQEIINDNPYSISFDNSRDYPRFNIQENLGAKWLKNAPNEGYVYGDTFGQMILLSVIYPPWRTVTFDNQTTMILYGSIIYFRSLNIDGMVPGIAAIQSYEKTVGYSEIVNTPLNPLLKNMDIIYINDGSKIYYSV